MATMAPGKHCREGITLLELGDPFSTEDAPGSGSRRCSGRRVSGHATDPSERLRYLANRF